MMLFTSRLIDSLLFFFRREREQTCPPPRQKGFLSLGRCNSSTGIRVGAPLLSLSLLINGHVDDVGKECSYRYMYMVRSRSINHIKNEWSLRFRLLVFYKEKSF